MDGLCCSSAAAVDTVQSVDVAVAEFPAAAPGRFVDDNTAFVQEFPVRGYEVAPNQRASMVTIANLLQVRATSQLRRWHVPSGSMLPHELR